MVQESHVTSSDQGVGGRVDQPEEGKAPSLLTKVKVKAKGTVRKLKSKVKRGSDDQSSEEVSSARSRGQQSEETTSDESDASSPSEAQRESSGVPTLSGVDGLQQGQKGSEQSVPYGNSPEEDRLKPFARSEAEKDSLTVTPLIATPTSYGERHTTVEDVMPPIVIEPTSVSNLGEESSSSLGNIPEARDDEKIAVKEVMEGGPDADINEGFRETFQQKDLQAIDGLPKPGGFDVGNGGRVDSGDLSFHRPPGLTDESRNREFPLGDAAHPRRIEQDNEKQHPPGSVAGLKDSMFSSNAVGDLKPNEPNAAEAKRAGEIGTFSRDFDPKAPKFSTEQGEPDPPAAAGQLHDKMFYSAVTSDLKPSQADKPSAEGAAATGDRPREGTSDGNEDFQDSPQELPPPALAE